MSTTTTDRPKTLQVKIERVATETGVAVDAVAAAAELEGATTLPAIRQAVKDHAGSAGAEPDADADDAQTLDELLKGAGIQTKGGTVRLGAAALAKVYDELEIGDATIVTPTDDQVARATAYRNGEKSGLIGKEAALWIILGDDGRKARADRHRLEQQMKATAAKGARRSRSATKRAGATVAESDQRAAEIGTETAALKGKKLSQRVSPKEAAKAREVVLAMLAELRADNRYPNLAAGADETSIAGVLPDVLGFTSERAFKRYVTGEDTALEAEKTSGSGRSARDQVKALTKGIASHQVWARKAAAAAYGVMAQMRETASAS